MTFTMTPAVTRVFPEVPTAPPTRPTWNQNQILAALPAEEYARMLPHLEHVQLPLGWVLQEQGAQMAQLYFPISGIVSLLHVMQNGASVEIAIVGNEGLVGVSLFMGGEATASRAVVQYAGAGYCLKADILRREFARGGPLQYLALRYTQALIVQMTQTGACNRHHTLDQQLCRWLLLSLDRLPGDELTMTQQLIANMLGVDLAGVTGALDKLQAGGMIRYQGGLITAVDRAGLERHVCECYAVVKKEFSRLLPYKLAA